MALSSVNIMATKVFKVFVKNTRFLLEIDKTSQQTGQDVVLAMLNALKEDMEDCTMRICSFDSFIGELLPYFETAPAAGGIVQNNNNEILWIVRRGMYDLPKGKLDKGEDFESAALREVEEECGLHDLKITKELGSTYHAYLMNDTPYFKETRWFAMHSQQKNLKLQAEEDISDYIWANAEKHRELREKTFRSLREFLDSI